MGTKNTLHEMTFFKPQILSFISNKIHLRTKSNDLQEFLILRHRCLVQIISKDFLHPLSQSVYEVYNVEKY